MTLQFCTALFCKATSSLVLRVAVAIVVVQCFSIPALAESRKSIPEEIEWTWEVRPQHFDAKLRNVLLAGDSITRSYYPQVVKDLEGIANVFLFSTSTSVGDPRLARQISEFTKMERVKFAVIHFNNGMHGWEYTELQFQASLPGFVHALAAVPGHAGLIWATITPVNTDAPSGATNSRIDARNAAAKKLVQEKNIAIDDLHQLMSGHADLYRDQDPVHFNDSGAELMGHQASEAIKRALRSSGR